MPVFKVVLKLFYRRTQEDHEYSGVPDLKNEDVSNFILTNNIHETFIEELGSDDAFGVLSHAKYDQQTNELSFNLTVDKDYLFVNIDDDVNEIIDQLKENLCDYSLEDSLYEGLRAAYTVTDAKHYYNDLVQFQNNNDDNEEYLEVGVIDYRNYDLIIIEHIPE